MYLPTLTKLIVAALLTISPLSVTGTPWAGLTKPSTGPPAANIVGNPPVATPTPTPAPGETWDTPFGPASKFAGWHAAHGYNDTHPLSANDTASLTSRTAVAGVYACDREGWKGACTYTIASGGACHAYPYDAYSSFGPDHGIRCLWYSDGGCGQSDGKWIVYPGCASVDQNCFWNYYWYPRSYRCQWL